MRHFKILISSYFILALYSCKTSPTNFATNWTNDIKEKIIEDVSQQPNKSVFDSSRYDLTLYKDDTKLKFFHFRPTFDTTGKVISLDTVLSIFYSTDQNFELVRELCPVIDKSFEGIKYRGNHLGLAEFRYCDGKIKKSGFRFNGDVGIWKEYDSIGKLINETDNGNIQRLEKLKEIKYYR